MGRISFRPPPTSHPPQETHVEEKKTEAEKAIPVPEHPVAVHNLEEKARPVIQQATKQPRVIEIDLSSRVVEVQLRPEEVPSFPPVIKIDPLNIPSVIGPFVLPDRVPDHVSLPSVIKIEIPQPSPIPLLVCPIANVPPPEINLPPLVLRTPAIPESALLKVEGLGRKLRAGDVVDSASLPPPTRSWNPDTGNKVVRWFDAQWKSDGDYELTNYCLFSTHMELELRRL